MKIPWIKKGQTDLTAFQAEELLFDYIKKSLSLDRKKAVDQHLQNSADLKKSLARIQKAIAYTQDLNRIHVSTALIEQVQHESQSLISLSKKYLKQPEVQFWFWWGRALSVFLIFVGGLSFFPWEKLRSKGGNTSAVMVEMDRSKDSQFATAESLPAAADKPKVEAAAEREIASTKPAAPVGKPKETVNVAASKAPVEQGFLYRGELSTSEVDRISDGMVAKIVDLGGQKAGAVELGWKKTSRQAYFHFTIPQRSLVDLETYLKQEGLILRKEKHSKIMPAGTVRVILTVDEK